MSRIRPAQSLSPPPSNRHRSLVAMHAGHGLCMPEARRGTRDHRGYGSHETFESVAIGVAHRLPGTASASFGPSAAIAAEGIYGRQAMATITLRFWVEPSPIVPSTAPRGSAHGPPPRENRPQ